MVGTETALLQSTFGHGVDFQDIAAAPGAPSLGQSGAPLSYTQSGGPKPGQSGEGPYRARGYGVIGDIADIEEIANLSDVSAGFTTTSLVTGRKLQVAYPFS